MGRTAGRRLHGASLSPAVGPVPARLRPRRCGAALRDRAPLRAAARERIGCSDLEPRRRVPRGATGGATVSVGASPALATGVDARLVRAIGTWGLAASIVNVTIGAGIFRLPSGVASALGAAAP